MLVGAERLFGIELMLQHGEVGLPDPTADDIVVQTEVSGVSVGTERWALIGKRAEIKPVLTAS